MIDSTTWFWSLFVIATLVILYYWLQRLGIKSRLTAAKFETERLQERIDTARTFYLETLQREIANLILSEDIEAFERGFNWVRQWQDEVEKAGKERRLAEYNLLLEKFPTLEYFDLIGTRHFVRYDHRPMWDLDEAVERYKDISKFLMVDESVPWNLKRAYDEHEIKIFREKMQTYKDLRLKDAIEEGMRRYYRSRKKDSASQDQDAPYSDDEFQVICLLRVPNRQFTPEVEYGVFWKERDEHGLYTFFAGDRKTYYSFYRSDAAFAKKDVLRS